MFTYMAAAAMLLASCGNAGKNVAAPADSARECGSKPVVYMTKEITPESLVKVYDALGVLPSGKVAVKISTGEPGGHNFLQPSLIKDLVAKVNGTIVECNTAYKGPRFETETHMKVFEDYVVKIPMSHNVDSLNVAAAAAVAFWELRSKD